MTERGVGGAVKFGPCTTSTDPTINRSSAVRLCCHRRWATRAGKRDRRTATVVSGHAPRKVRSQPLASIPAVFASAPTRPLVVWWIPPGGPTRAVTSMPTRTGLSPGVAGAAADVTSPGVAGRLGGAHVAVRSGDIDAVERQDSEDR